MHKESISACVLIATKGKRGISAAVNPSFSLCKHVHHGHDEGCRICERRAIGSRLGCGDGIPSWPLPDCEGGAKCSARSSFSTADLHPLHSNTISNPQGDRRAARVITEATAISRDSIAFDSCRVSCYRNRPNQLEIRCCRRGSSWLILCYLRISRLLGRETRILLNYRGAPFCIPVSFQSPRA